jgi:hypothetical protein
MALLVRRGLHIEVEQIRTFQRFAWHKMPRACVPVDPDTGRNWYPPNVWSALRLSSKSHWDVPIRTAGGGLLHVLCSHPTPPVFDGPEDRNGCRNHDEIRFWAEYLNGASWIEDDMGNIGGLAKDQACVILGDLNADPDEGDSRDDPIGRYLFSHPRIDASFVPKNQADTREDKLSADDTARWGLRVDYVLPSSGLRLLDGGVERHAVKTSDAPSDHFLVWIEVQVP